VTHVWTGKGSVPQGEQPTQGEQTTKMLASADNKTAGLQPACSVQYRGAAALRVAALTSAENTIALLSTHCSMVFSASVVVASSPNTLQARS
jgi:hypothetical protein